MPPSSVRTVKVSLPYDESILPGLEGVSVPVGRPLIVVAPADGAAAVLGDVVIGASGTGVGEPVGCEVFPRVLVVDHPDQEDVHRLSFPDFGGGAVQVVSGLVGGDRGRLQECHEADQSGQHGESQHGDRPPKDSS